MKSEYTQDGYRIFTPPPIKLPLKAAYGAYLIQLCKDADKLGEEEERFVEIEPMTLAEFKDARKIINRKKLFKR